MQQAVMMAPGTIVFREMPIPEITEGQVLIKVAAIGICGSDIHVYHGKHPFTSYPIVQGHEMAGFVERVGDAVTDLQPGELITIRPQLVCGQCGPCRRGQAHICDHLKVLGFQADGTGAEYAAIDHELVYHLPASLTPEIGAMIEPLAVALHAVRRAGALIGRRVLVLGAGPIGNLVAQVVRASGATTVVSDTSAFRRQLALDCGIPHALDAGDPDFEQHLLEIMGPEMPDVVFECVGGASSTMDRAVACVRKGGTIVIVGLFAAKAAVDMARIQDAEINVIGSLMYQHDDYLGVIDLLARKAVNLDRLITHRFSFQQFPEVYQFIEEHREQTMKVMVHHLHGI